MLLGQTEDFLKSADFKESSSPRLERKPRLEFEAAIIRSFGKPGKASSARGLIRAPE